MKNDYQKPSVKVIQIDMQQHLLKLSGGFGGVATKPPKSRRQAGWDDDDWNDENWSDENWSDDEDV